MKVVFVGNVLPEDVFFEVSSISPSTNNVQLNYINYLHDVFGRNLFVYSSNLSIKKKMCSSDNSNSIDSFSFKTKSGITIKTVSFSKKRFFLNISLIINLKSEIRRLIDKHPNERFVFIVNNHFYYHALPVFLVKRKCDLVITILNEALDVRYLPAHGKVRIKDYISNLINFHLLRRNNGLISFSKKSIIDYHLDKIPYIELIHTSKFELQKEFDKDRSDSFILFYAGLINHIYGIESILSAMNYLPERFKLIICGGGDQSLINLISDKSKKDTRIQYLGLIQREKVLEYEKQSNLLLMVRKIDTKHDKYIATYSQPSKIVEYLLSGTPVLATDIEGIPHSLKKYINLVDGDDSFVLANEILSVEKQYELNIKKAAKGKEYASVNCSLESQKKRIISFILQLLALDKENGNE